jgi:ATP-dependent NAD(P)H-hydrate dehydratase
MTDSEPEKHCAKLARKLGHNIVIIQKGADDIISHGALVPDFISVQSSDTLVDSIQGGLKRVGGQGDILSGTTGTLLAWGREWARGAYAHLGDEYAPDDQLTPHVALLAAYGASAFNRTVSRRGFEAKGRSMVTHDLVDLVGPVYEDMFGDKSKGKGRL